MSRNLAEQLALLPDYLSQHILVTVTALGLGIALSLPLAILVTRIPTLRGPTLTTVSLIQTIPGLALLALMVPLLGAFGFWPAVTALTLYSMLPVVRNTVTGILELDPSLTEAARALGMTSNQRLMRVEIPLALPMIVAGIRTAAVWVVGMATLSTPVGQTSLGNFIFSGLQTRNWTAVLIGCGAAAALAICLDLLAGLLESSARNRRKGRASVGLVALSLLLLAGLSPLVISFDAAPPPPPAGVLPEENPKAALDRPIRIGAKSFTEQYILAALLDRLLRRSGYAVERLEGLGSSIAFDALSNDEIDCYVDYTGTLWANVLGQEQPVARWRVLTRVASWLAEQRNIRCLGSLGFENAYALALRRSAAERMGLRSIDDLVSHARELKIGSDYEFFSRPEWHRLRDTYGLKFRERVGFDSTFMYPAVRDGDVDVITAFTTDGRIDAFDLTLLPDPRQALPPYDAVLLLAPGVADEPGLCRALSPLLGAIVMATMRRANARVDLDGQTVEQAADWLLLEVDAHRVK